MHDERVLVHLSTSLPGLSMGKQSISVHSLPQLVSSGDLRIYRFFNIACWMDDSGAGPVDPAAFNGLIESERSAS
jgi:hypothetical protein